MPVICECRCCKCETTTYLISADFTLLTDLSLQSADKDQRVNGAVAGKPHVWCRCKIRHASKLTTTSRGSPAIAWLSCSFCCLSTLEDIFFR